MAESCSAPSPGPSKPVVVRVKRKPFHSPLDAFWLEINERPFKRPLLDFRNLSISESSSSPSRNVEIHNKKVLVQHVETISSSEVTLDIVQSFVEPGYRSASESKPNVEGRKTSSKKLTSKISSWLKLNKKNRLQLKTLVLSKYGRAGKYTRGQLMKMHCKKYASFMTLFVLILKKTLRRCNMKISPWRIKHFCPVSSLY